MNHISSLEVLLLVASLSLPALVLASSLTWWGREAVWRWLTRVGSNVLVCSLALIVWLAFIVLWLLEAGRPHP
jgi:hypothetical protein